MKLYIMENLNFYSDNVVNLGEYLKPDGLSIKREYINGPNELTTMDGTTYSDRIALMYTVDIGTRALPEEIAKKIEAILFSDSIILASDLFSSEETANDLIGIQCEVRDIQKSYAHYGDGTLVSLSCSIKQISPLETVAYEDGRIGIAYAYYDEATGVLSFDRAVNRQSIPSGAWTDIEDTDFSANGQPPWAEYSYCYRIKEIIFNAPVIPVSTALWFVNMNNVEKFDIANLNTRRTTNMAGMFWGLGAKISDLSSLDTSNVEAMEYMFCNCTLEEKAVSTFDTSRVKYMFMMFAACKSEALDLSNFDTGEVRSMYDMFYACSHLKTIYASESFVTPELTFNMFSGCGSLVGGNGTSYDNAHVDNSYARIDTEETPGYFTKKAEEDGDDNGGLEVLGGGAAE